MLLVEASEVLSVSLGEGVWGLTAGHQHWLLTTGKRV